MFSTITSDPLVMYLIGIIALLSYLLIARRYQRSKRGLYTGHLDEVTINLTELARQNELDPLVGRAEELERMMHILLRRTKNNPLLIGESGVGKTAIVEGLAQKIVDGSVPDMLQEKEILSLDVNALVAETKFRGELEQRLKRMIKELMDQKDHIILFIDEIHLVSQIGAAQGSLNIADVLKPTLARGHIQVIGATTYDDFTHVLHQDAAFSRRLQPVVISEADKAETMDILHRLKSVYESFHGVTVKEEALKSMVSLSKKHLKERKLPDSAIDLLDETCAMVSAHKKKQVRAKDVKEVVEQWVSYGDVAKGE